METLSTLLKLGFAELKEFAPETVTFRSNDYDCVQSGIDGSDAIVIGGVEDNVALALAIDLSDLLAADSGLSTVGNVLCYTSGSTTRPVVGLTVTFHTATYRVLSADVDSSNSVVMFRLGTPHR